MLEQEEIEKEMEEIDFTFQPHLIICGIGIRIRN